LGFLARKLEAQIAIGKSKRDSSQEKLKFVTWKPKKQFWKMS